MRLKLVPTDGRAPGKPSAWWGHEAIHLMRLICPKVRWGHRQPRRGGSGRLKGCFEFSLFLPTTWSLLESRAAFHTQSDPCPTYKLMVPVKTVSF